MLYKVRLMPPPPEMCFRSDPALCFAIPGDIAKSLPFQLFDTNCIKMVAPCLEVLMFDVGTHTIDDPATEDGQKWREVFYGLPKAPGFIRAGFGRNVGLDGGKLGGGRITILVGT